MVGNMKQKVANPRFPIPWSVEEEDGCFVVRDNNGQALSRVHFKDKHGRRSAAKLFTREEAQHMAVSFAKLPELFQKS